MFNNPQPDPPQVRTRCRNPSPHCGCALQIPTDNPRDAFCCKGCETQFYNRHCRVCETVISPQKTKPKAVCQRSRCKHEFQRHPERYFGPRYPKVGLGQISSKTDPATHTAGLGQISSRSAHSTGLKTGFKPDRPYRVIAGSGADLHPINLRVDSSVLPRVNTGPVLITRTTPPVNVIGGYRWPGAPKIDLGPTPNFQSFAVQRSAATAGVASAGR